MEKFLLLAIIFIPIVTAALYLIFDSKAIRKFISIVTVFVMSATAIAIAYKLMHSPTGVLTYAADEHIQYGIYALELILFAYVLYVSLKFKKFLAFIFAAVQFVLLILFEIVGVFGEIVEPEIAFSIDYLSLIMLLIVSIIGPLVILFGIDYMDKHEGHKPAEKRKSTKAFFVTMYVFIGVMNALVSVNNIMWFLFFWEVTTVFSFTLIKYDATPISYRNAFRALIINLGGGLSFLIGIIILFCNSGTIALNEIVKLSYTGSVPLALAFICLAAFTKAAQFPFQSWLLGAMVAPTPVSALLHSSTMVKGGVYLVIRMSPIFSGTLLGNMVSIIGAFTFLVASAVAIGERNGKRVLAYSTIANLGLIFCCAGMGGGIAIGAAILLMIFHALSKGLLFLCIGTIEQGIGSRDIEDMQGLMKKMPFTTCITVMGMISMLLPPFGVLVTKWLALEASANDPLVLGLLIFGSAFTVVFWAQWIGIILTMSYKKRYIVEKLTKTAKTVLVAMISMVVAVSFFMVFIYDYLIKPYINAMVDTSGNFIARENINLAVERTDDIVLGGFTSMWFFIIIFVLLITIPSFLKNTRASTVKPPYLCGANTDDKRGIEFWTAKEEIDEVIVHNYYFANIFGTRYLTFFCNSVAIGMILIMFGVVL